MGPPPASNMALNIPIFNKAVERPSKFGLGYSKLHMCKKLLELLSDKNRAKLSETLKEISDEFES